MLFQMEKLEFTIVVYYILSEYFRNRFLLYCELVLVTFLKYWIKSGNTKVLLSCAEKNNNNNVNILFRAPEAQMIVGEEWWVIWLKAAVAMKYIRHT